jgi:hypothetical protein
MQAPYPHISLLVVVYLDVSCDIRSASSLLADRSTQGSLDLFVTIFSRTVWPHPRHTGRRRHGEPTYLRSPDSFFCYGESTELNGLSGRI